MVTVPWQSIWLASYPHYEWDGEAGNPKTCLEYGMLDDWFHCSVWPQDTIARQQTAAFTDPYTDSSSEDAGFVILEADDAFPAAVGVAAAASIRPLSG